MYAIGLPERSLGELEEDGGVKIEMIRSAYGANCRVNCAHCGARNSAFRTDRLESVRMDLVRKKLESCVGPTLSEMFAPYVTTDVNADPVFDGEIGKLAHMVVDSSDDKSSLAVITHGGSDRQLSPVIDLMRRDIVRLFVLTVDRQRFSGRVSERSNRYLYFQTIAALAGGMDTRARLTLSIQGQTDRMVQELREMVFGIFREIGIEDEASRFVFDERAEYVSAGEAKTQGIARDAAACDVIPDVALVESLRAQGLLSHKHRILVREDGSMIYQFHEQGNTYGTTVKEPWGVVT